MKFDENIEKKQILPKFPLTNTRKECILSNIGVESAISTKY